jgi:hypothetical protein
MFTCKPIFGPVNRATLSTETPVAITASRRLALPIVCSMRSAPSSATLASITREILFSLGYVSGFTVSDGAHGMLRDTAGFGDLENAPVWVSQ